MASPRPDSSLPAPALNEQTESNLEGERKPELNGHTTSVDIKNESTMDAQVDSVAGSRQELSTDSVPAVRKPLVNGNDSTSESAPTNGVSNVAESKAAPEDASSLANSSSNVTNMSTLDGPTDDASAGQSHEETSVAAPLADSLPRATEDVTMEDVERAPTVEQNAAAQNAAEATDGSVAGPNTSVAKMEDATEDSKAAVKASTVENSEVTSQDTTALPTSEGDLQPASLSQLNIETEPEQSAVISSVEVTMGDASNSKVAHERDDDAADEPAAKRARTEPEEDPSLMDTSTTKPTTDASPKHESSVAEHPQVDADSTVVAATGPSVPSDSLDSLLQWRDPEVNNRPLTAYQRREIRKTISRLKKTKSGGNFKDSVQKLWPNLWEGYLAKIDKPMDLSEVDRNLRDDTPYSSLGQLKDDVSLIYLNALAFNGVGHGVTSAAFSVVKSIWDEALSTPAEEPARPRPVPKAKPVRESRNVATVDATTRRQSAGPAASPSFEVTEEKEASQPADRRNSTNTEGDRPKRTVRAPKPKDIDYAPKQSKRKLEPDLQYAQEILDELKHPKHERLNVWFREPVDAAGMNVPDYYNKIKKPMDFGKITRMLAEGQINSFKDFDKTVRLVFENAYTFNGPPAEGNHVSLAARDLENIHKNRVKELKSWRAKFDKANAQASASNPSDDEEDDDEDEIEDGTAVDNSRQIQELNAKLQEETTKLHEMFVPGANAAMISIQKGIVDMVQQALMKAVASASEAQPKSDKPAKKTGKAAKGKAAGSNRKSLGTAPAKKAGGTKKAAAKKSLTAADKDAIANAINDLESSHLDRAIDIIKRDTGQNENNDGELELDIDQLSTEALLKLWELCKKALPGFGKDSTAAHASSEVSRTNAKQASKAAPGKPKKNKPMSAQEQEARIAHLTALRQMYKEGQDGPDMATASAMQSPPKDESSDDSDSEEE